MRPPAWRRAAGRALFLPLAALVALDFYAIFSAGGPHSPFRLLLPDPRYDGLLTLVLSLAVLLLALALAARRGGRLAGLLAMNREHILALRREGASDAQIADSFLNELKAPTGILRSLVRGRVMRYLSKLR